MAYYRGRIGADLNKPAFGKEDIFDPTANNGSPYFLLTPAFGWDPYRLPTYDLQELITDYGITNTQYSQTYNTEYQTVDDDFSGTDRNRGIDYNSYYTLTEAEGTYLYDSTTPITFTVTSPYTITTRTNTTTRDAGAERTFDVDSDSHLVTSIELVGQPGDTTTNGAMGGDIRIINDYNLENDGTREYTVVANGSSTYFSLYESSVNNYGGGHREEEYGSFLYTTDDVSARCDAISIEVTNPVTGNTQSYNATLPTRRSIDNGYIWNTAEADIHGGTGLIRVRTTSNLPFQAGTRIKFTISLQTYENRGANNDITSLYNITLNRGTSSSLPSVGISKKANPGRNLGAPKGAEISGTVVWPYAIYTYSVNTSGHSSRAWTNILGYSWIEDAHAYKSAQYPVKNISVTVRQANGNVSPVGYNIVRPSSDGIHGYLNGIQSASNGIDNGVIINFTSGQMELGMTVEIEVEYDILEDTNAGVDWTNYFDAAVNDINTSDPKLIVYGKGTSAGRQLGIDAGVGVPYGMEINAQFYRVNTVLNVNHSISEVLAAGHDDQNFGYSLGGLYPTYGCYEVDVVVRNESGQNRTSQCSITLPPQDFYSYYDVSQPIGLTLTNGDAIPYNWTVDVTNKHQIYTDIGANQDITSDYTWTEEYINPNNYSQGVYLKVVKNGTQVGPPNNLYMRTRYFWDLDPGGLPIVVLLNQNFYGR